MRKTLQRFWTGMVLLTPALALADALDWMTNLGAPGYANAALDDAYGTWVLNTMFARAATGADTAEAAVKQADQKLRQIWQKWQARALL